ncbi:Caffeic acid 3-O-methyltransferase [Morus notabilis]|uniref:Caffeic acid 3-O-methyltransferase n=1 Tax=Morus notabilis TaxID=981085 RepID=W9R8F4_9ROSA|nr:caffeic acid 3-O-methyltransferase [Morus notabilis]EXB75933.1 Caffeic acid 3-O-methyltransferase [Morus notabilis]
MEDESSEKRNQARLKVLELANMISVPMSLNAVVRLGVPDAIWQSGSNSPLSASQILTRVLPSSSSSAASADPDNLQRLLRTLTSYGVFSEHISGEIRKYSLTDVGKTLVTDSDGLSYAPYVLQHHQDALMRAWSLLHEAVVDPTTEPFAKANGEPAYKYYGKMPEMNGLMQRAMSGVSVPFMKAILNGYDGFEGVRRLVDVGGSAGDCLRMILQKYPNVTEAINFDLPEVVARAPHVPGVTHVGGDMFKLIPEADAIFMKWILTTWTDDECQAIMESCCKAVPGGGKLIACEPVLPKETDDSHRTRALLSGDIFVMTIYRAKGKHRTEDEYRKLGLAAGFPHFQAFYIDYFHTVLEFTK